MGRKTSSLSDISLFCTCIAILYYLGLTVKLICIVKAFFFTVCIFFCKEKVKVDSFYNSCLNVNLYFMKASNDLRLFQSQCMICWYCYPLTCTCCFWQMISAKVYETNQRVGKCVFLHVINFSLIFHSLHQILVMMHSFSN